ncbi:glycosyltransferase family 2 protein [Tropicimonas sp. TH_r6]|uniref:glycosyltransferase family 2 protein n=1 Tax=Tropicimonas sp. TH_r6 TaxID=3082085 RepID=UPI002954FF2E|nr:glycosyltransferase family 2 protein [Tropicimonas sp. TH_r6]MDV7141403.1 glycosyltransferase family 2 protein [Tropicimonas sp. TH_r6]
MEDWTGKWRDRLVKSGLFDPDWYARAYPDVARSGMEPLEHFLALGAAMRRDPGPGFSEAFYRIADPAQQGATESALRRRLEMEEPKVRAHLVMVAAKALCDAGRIDDAMTLVREHARSLVPSPAWILRANRALLAGSERDWLASLNGYLDAFDILPIVLADGGTLLHRLTTGPVAKTTGGPKVSVLMSVFDSEDTVQAAVESILHQSWTNLELLIVDDCSTDGTWTILQQLADADSRVKIRRNQKNLGPFVSKNIALQDATGAWITGQDGDDWSHPQRLEKHLRAILQSEGAVKAGTVSMLRVGTTGCFEDFIPASAHHSPDGIRRRAFISCLFERETLNDRLGFWDSVRFGADGEMIKRAEKVLGPAFQDHDQLTMICFNLSTSLTNHTEFGLRTAAGVSQTRRQYNEAFHEWHMHTDPARLRLSFPLEKRPFEVPEVLAAGSSGNDLSNET